MGAVHQKRLIEFPQHRPQRIFSGESCVCHDFVDRQVAEPLERRAHRFFDLPEHIPEEGIGCAEFDDLIAGAASRPFQGEVKGIEGHKHRRAILDDEGIVVIKALSKRFDFRAGLSGDENDRNVLRNEGSRAPVSPRQRNTVRCLRD